LEHGGAERSVLRQAGGDFVFAGGERRGLYRDVTAAEADDDRIERRGAEAPRMRMSDPGATAPDGTCGGMRLAKLPIPPWAMEAAPDRFALPPESRCT